MWIDEQQPRGDQVFLCHVGYFVRDLGEAGAAFERLGFQVSPINVLSHADAEGRQAPGGTSNRLVRLRRGFIEILAATHDTPIADQLKSSLARYQGLHLISASHDDIPATRARLAREGFRMQEPVELRRPAKTPAGMREVGWSVQRLEPGEMPEGRVQFVKSHTPDLSWPADAIVHENKADGLGDLLVCVADRREAAGRFARFLGKPPVEEGGRTVFPLERGRILLVEPDGVTALPDFTAPSLPYMAGIAVRSADLAATAALLKRRGIRAVHEDADLICLGPADALGSCLLFHRPEVPDPWLALMESRKGKPLSRNAGEGQSTEVREN